MGMKIDSDGIIELVGMEFHANHGCLEQERKEGNTFLVDFRGMVDIKKAARTDDLSYTADYGKVYDIIAREMAVPSNLLENVAGRIVDSIVREIPMLFHVMVRVSKKNPPVGGTCSWSRVTASYGSDLLGIGDPHSF